MGCILTWTLLHIFLCRHFSKILILFFLFANFCGNFGYELQIAFDFANKQDIELKYRAYNKSWALIHQEICWRVEWIRNFCLLPGPDCKQQTRDDLFRKLLRDSNYVLDKSSEDAKYKYN